MVYLFDPGRRKLVSNKSDGVVRVIGETVDNFDLGRESWVLFENTGDGTKFVKKRRTEGDDGSESIQSIQGHPQFPCPLLSS